MSAIGPHQNSVSLLRCPDLGGAQRLFLFVLLASRESFGGLQGAIASGLRLRLIIPIQIDAGPSTREADFEASCLGHRFVFDDADRHQANLPEP